MNDHPPQVELMEEQPQQALEQHTRRQTWLVLFGSAILQLPIWGFAMTFGVFQEAYSREPQLHNVATSSGVIGMTTNGVMYLLMPILFTALDRGRWSAYRRIVAIVGILISSSAFLLSSWSTELWHLILTQGILAALGNTLIYSPTTLYLDEYFTTKGRPTAYGAVYSSKNIVGSGCPLMFSALLTHLGFRWTIRIWALIVLITGLAGLAVMPKRPSSFRRVPQKIPWTFLKHRTFYIYCIANATFSSGYGIPQTYLSTYAKEILGLSTLSSSLMIVLFNAPGIISCVGFGLLSDRLSVSAGMNTFISAYGSAACALFLWGLASNRIPAGLICFSLFFGFFSGGYSSTWSGWITDLESEAAKHNEAVNTGMLYGLLNGARGVGYVVSGLAGVELLKSGSVSSHRWGYGTRYGGLILFTGLSCVIGGWSLVWRSSACGRRA